MARDWRFPPGSFRGATFYVDQGAPSGGRRKAVHEYPGSEYWDVEDLGTKAKRLTFTAYFVSETADADYAALIAACDQPGAAQLVLPFFGACQASAETWEPSWNQEKLNYVGGSFTFILENPAGAPTAVGLGERIVAAALAAASSLIGGAVSALFAGTGTTSADRAQAASDLGDAVAFVTTVLQSVALPDDTAAAATMALAALAPQAGPAAETDPGPFLTAALDQLDAVAIEATPAEAVAPFTTAAALAVALVPPSVGDQPDPTQVAATIPTAVATAAAMQVIRLLGSASYADRQAAIAAREAMRAAAVAVLPVVGSLGPEVQAAFADLWGAGATQLTRLIADLAPIRLMRTNASLPATALAYRLYADPSRAVELVQRNRVATPLFMPSTFEAATR